MNLDNKAQWAYTETYMKGPTAAELNAFKENHNLTDRELADQLGVNHRTVRKWRLEERSMPWSAWRLLHLVYDNVDIYEKDTK